MGTDKTEQRHLSSWCQPGEMTTVISQRKTYGKNGILREEGRDAEFMNRITPFRSESICEIREIRGQFLLVPATPG